MPQNTQRQLQKATDKLLLREPLHALLNGQPVRLIATADIEGMSPVYLVINGQGQSTWESFSDVQITDPNALPMIQSQRTAATR